VSRLTVIRGGLAPRRHRGARPFDARTPAVEMFRRRRAWKVGPGHFQVSARDGCTRYRVLATPAGETTCTCRVGRFGGACWHQCVVLRRLLREGAEGWRPASEAST
jgi:hypothetical protein